MSGHSPFVCARCHTIIRNKYDQYRERLEFVRADMKQRERVFTLRLLCRSCVDAEVVRREGLPESMQDQLFD